MNSGLSNALVGRVAELGSLGGPIFTFNMSARFSFVSFVGTPAFSFASNHTNHTRGRQWDPI